MFLLLGPRAVLAANPVAVPMPGRPSLDFGHYSLAAEGYTEREFFVSGMALAFQPGKDAAGAPAARRWGSQPYTTRIVVLAPRDARRFNGTVLVEWLNVSAHRDIPVEWIMLHRELIRAGYAYVAVSAQPAGVQPGHFGWLFGTQGKPLKAIDPARYGGLHLPGNPFSFDIFSDIGRLLKSQPALLLGPLRPARLIAAGESQSAFYLATYVNDIDPQAKVYDGYFIHSRAGAAAALDGGSFFGASPAAKATPVRLRADLRVPVLQLVTETDLAGLAGFIGFAAARQPDNAHLRSWEIAGAAHVDNYLLFGGGIDTARLPLPARAAIWRPRRRIGNATYSVAINNAPQHHYVAEAALAALNGWIATGLPPANGAPVMLGRHDAAGNLLGGIRTPWVDVPTATYSGTVGLTGSAVPFTRAELARRYPRGRAGYMREFATALDRALAARFILPADRSEILSIAKANF